jgi:hypothetical protein
LYKGRIFLILKKQVLKDKQPSLASIRHIRNNNRIKKICDLLLGQFEGVLYLLTVGARQQRPNYRRWLPTSGPIL